MVFLFIGIGIGIVLGLLIDRVRADGALIVRDLDEYKTHWTLQVNTDPEKIPKKRSIRLQVHVQK